MANVWYNYGLSNVHDAVVMASENKLPGLRLIGSHQDRYAPVLQVADAAFVEPNFATGTADGAAAYVAYCLDVCRTRSVDLFVVQGGRRALADHVEDFRAAGTQLMVPGNTATLRLLDDKARFYDAALPLGLPMPWTAEVHDADGFDAAIACLAKRGTDMCVKPPKGIFGAGFWRLDDALPLFESLMWPDLHAISTAKMRAAFELTVNKRLLVMEYLPGVEWSVDCLCDAGRMLAGISRRKLGRAQLIEVEGPMIDLARQTIAAFGLSGLINVQFKAAGPNDTDPRLLEVNARMSGGCLYTRASGVNLPWWQVAIALGARTADQIPTPVGGALVGSIMVAQHIAESFADPVL